MTTDLDLEDRDAVVSALRHHLRDVDPDLDRLISVATTQGTRIRRTRRLAASGAALASLAAVAASVAVIGSAVGDAPRPADAGTPAASLGASDPVSLAPTCSSSASGGGPVLATPSEDRLQQFHVMLGRMPSDVPAGKATSPGALTPMDCGATGGPAPQTAPVTLALPGWTCGPAADDKMECSAAGATVLVTWRPAADHDRWLTDPDKTAPYVGQVHGDLFVTVGIAEGTPLSAATTVGEALRWIDE